MASVKQEDALYIKKKKKKKEPGFREQNVNVGNKNMYSRYNSVEERKFKGSPRKRLVLL